MLRSSVSFVIVMAVLIYAGKYYQQCCIGTVPSGVMPSLMDADGDWYVAVDEDEVTWDHYILYTGYGSAISAARRADVVIIGSSRSQWNLDSGMMLDFAANNGLTLYNLAVGHGESNRFGEILIEQQNLHPRVVLAPVDTSDDATSFRGKMSPFGTKIVKEGQLAALEYTYDTLWLKQIQHRTRTIFPYFRAHTSPAVVERSWSSGFWNRPGAYQTKGTISFPAESKDTRPDELRRTEEREALAFVERMRAHGIQVIFFWYPVFGAGQDRAVELAALAGVPLIAPSGDGLLSADRSHLDPESARRYTASFLEQLPGHLREVSGR